jgi:hypothetical protein
MESVRKTRREERPISRFQHLREPQWQTHRCSGATVGDSPRGPLKQQGNPRLKHATKLNTPRLTMQDTAHAAEAPNSSPRRPARRSPRAGEACSRMYAYLRWAPSRSRGCIYLEQAPPRSRARSPLEQAPPRSRVRSALERGPPRSRVPRTRAPAPVRWHLMP